ncbi:MAG: hypothetical protein K2X01_11905 [Cyanobacteria bacterium]|nr:hypothetical protein [Cyanobacteriota bacterium]
MHSIQPKTLFTGVPVASNPRGKVTMARNIQTGSQFSYSDWEIRQAPVAILKNGSGQISGVVDVYKQGNRWMTDQLVISGSQG